ncbi:MAG TPA: nucleotidyltransferase family protein, partial [Solirubrobacterales bacterium]
ARNQAAVHLWFPDKFGYDVEPFGSTAEAIASWPETATSVAVRLNEDDDLAVVAPCGLSDLLGMVHRRNPARVTVEEYERRLATKRIGELWPRVTIIR